MKFEVELKQEARPLKGDCRVAPILEVAAAAEAAYVGMNLVKGFGVLVFDEETTHEKAREKLMADWRVADTHKVDQEHFVEINELTLTFDEGSTLPQDSFLGLQVSERFERNHYVALKTTAPISGSMISLLKTESVRIIEPRYKFSPLPLVPPEAQEGGCRLPKVGKTPNDSRYQSSELWGLDFIKAPKAWKHGADASRIVVAVIDSGINYNHPELAPNMWRDAQGYYGRNFAELNRPFDPIDEYGHGTHVAGIIGAKGDNAEGTTGVAWNVKLMAVKAFSGPGTYDYDVLARSIEYAIDNGARIINISWGTPFHAFKIKDAVDRAEAQGILLVCCAGNESGASNDRYPYFPGSYLNPNILAVAAIDCGGGLFWQSSIGETSVDLAAPGSAILSTELSGYGLRSGTSQATPFVAGAAALTLSSYCCLSPSELRELILCNVKHLPSLTGKVLSEGSLSIAFLGR